MTELRNTRFQVAALLTGSMTAAEVALKAGISDYGAESVLRGMVNLGEAVRVRRTGERVWRYRKRRAA